MVSAELASHWQMLAPLSAGGALLALFWASSPWKASTPFARSHDNAEALPDERPSHTTGSFDDLVDQLAQARNSKVFVFAFGHPATRGALPLTDQAVRFFLHALRQVQKLDPNKPIDIILHCPVMVDEAEEGPCQSMALQIARALKAHAGPTTVFIPFVCVQYASLIAIAADKIAMADRASLIFFDDDKSALCRAIAKKGTRNTEDLILLRNHSTQRLRKETATFICELMHDGRHGGHCRRGNAVSNGEYSLANPISAASAEKFGLTSESVSPELSLLVQDIIAACDSGLPRSSVNDGSGASDDNASAGVCLPTCHIGVRPFMRQFESRRNSRVVCVIHDKAMSDEDVDLLSSVEILRFLESIDNSQDIDIILQSPGGDALYGLQIAQAIKAHKGRKTVFVPYFAYSAGTIIALAADEIVMSPNAVLGPIDTQIGIHIPELGKFVTAPASAYAALPRLKSSRKLSTTLLAQAHSAATCEKAHEANMLQLMQGTYSTRVARKIVRTLNDGRYTHGYPITFSHAKKLGLKVSDQMPDEPMDIVEYFRGDRSKFCSIIHCSS